MKIKYALLALAASLILNAAVAVAPGTAAPDFTLTSSEGNTHSLSEFKGKFVVLEWVNHSCPFVVKHYESGNMQKLQAEWTGKGVVWLSVCSSAIGKQGFMEPAAIVAARKAVNAASTAYLMDKEGTVGKAYGARVTPEIVIINPEGVVVYHGAIDSIPSANPADVSKATNYVAAALEAALAGKPVATPATKPYGCGVKYGK